MERRPRTPSNLGVLFVHRLGDLVLEFLTRFSEFTHALAKPAGKFRELLGAEQQENRKKDQKDFLRTEAHSDEGGKSVHLSGSLGRGLEDVKGKFRREERYGREGSPLSMWNGMAARLQLNYRLPGRAIG